MALRRIRLAALVAVVTLGGCATPYGAAELDGQEPAPGPPPAGAVEEPAPATPPPASPKPEPKPCDGVTFELSDVPTPADEEYGARWDSTHTTLLTTRTAVLGAVHTLFSSSGFGAVDAQPIALSGPGLFEYPTLSKDGQSLYFDAIVGPNWQIFVSKRVLGVFGPPEPVGNINGLEQDLHPYIVGDALYWAQGPENGRRINRYDLATGETIEGVLALRARIANPVPTPDELTLYFTLSSDGANERPWVHVATRERTDQPFTSYRRVDALGQGSSVTWVSADRCELLFDTRANSRRVVRSATSRPR